MSRESIFHATAALLPDPLRPIEDWGKSLGDTAAVTAMLDRLLHHAQIIKCGPQSWRTREKTGLRNKKTGLRNNDTER